MDVVKRSGEIVARQVSRRTFLNKTAGGLFGAVSALTLDITNTSVSHANDTCSVYESGHTCSPISNKFCSSAYCQGAGCNGAYCSYFKIVHTSYGCWCTATAQYNCGTGNSYAGYYKCCDCSCPGGACTCQNFNYTCFGCVGAAVVPGVAPSAGVTPNCVPCC